MVYRANREARVYGDVENLYTIGAVSFKTGVPRRTLNRWVNRGLVNPIHKRFNGTLSCRLFTDHDVNVVKGIKRCRDRGYDLPTSRHITRIAIG